MGYFEMTSQKNTDDPRLIYIDIEKSEVGIIFFKDESCVLQMNVARANQRRISCDFYRSSPRCFYINYRSQFTSILINP